MESDSNDSRIEIKRVSPPESCGFHLEMTDDLVVRLTIRGTFDRENKGKPWASEVIEVYNEPILRLEVDFRHTIIVSSTVFAGLVQLYHGFHEKSAEGIYLTNVGTQVLRSLKMLKLDSLFTIRLRGQG
jgi:anti-anti-sigma regulatory factor